MRVAGFGHSPPGSSLPQVADQSPTEVSALDQACSSVPICSCPSTWLRLTLGIGLVTVPFCVLGLLLAKGTDT